MPLWHRATRGRGEVIGDDAPRRPVAGAPEPARGGDRPQVADLVAGISVALVALPQALAYAELAGMPPVTGLYALAIPAVVAALFAATPQLQVGPVATTSLLTFGVLSTFAAPATPTYVAMAGLMALLVGAIRVALGVLGWGRIAYLLSQPVLRGFVNAAAVLILLSQLPAALGVQTHSDVIGGAWDALMRPGQWKPAAIGFTAGTVLLVHQGRRLHPLFPGVLVALLGGLLLSPMLDYQGAVVGPVHGVLPTPTLELPWRHAPRLLLGAAVIALVGFSEAASIARDYAARDRRAWSPDREFVAQGSANLAAGLFGGFPVGASFSRSAVNRLAGARTRWSGAVTGVLVLAALPAAGLLAPLPKASLAGVVIAAVVGLLRPRQLWTIYRASRSQGVIATTTFVLTLVLAPRIDEAVLVGVVLAIGQHLRRERKPLLVPTRRGDTLVVALYGVLWYGSTAAFEQGIYALLAKHRDAAALELDLGGVGRIDYSAALAIRELLDDVSESGMTARLRRVPPVAARWTSGVWRGLDQGDE